MICDSPLGSGWGDIRPGKVQAGHRADDGVVQGDLTLFVHFEWCVPEELDRLAVVNVRNTRGFELQILEGDGVERDALAFLNGLDEVGRGMPEGGRDTNARGLAVEVAKVEGDV